MYNFIVFSKDRACQLDLMFRSIKTFFKDWNKYPCNVLYTYSSDIFKQGYDKITKKHQEFNYIIEQNFKNDVIKLISPNEPYTMFGVDDDVFKEPFDPNCFEVQLLDTEDQIACISLRMHPNINYCYTENRPTPPPVSFLRTNPYIWEWKGLLGDWSYPWSVDYSVFRTKDIIEKCHTMSYRNPNTFEGNLAALSTHRPWMICFEKSKIINIPANRVQTANGNRCGNISAEYLNNMYLNGYKISLENIKGFNNVSAHQEIPLNMVEE